MASTSTSARPVTVSYQVIPDANEWDKIKPDVLRQLPLRNLHWQSSSRSIRTIQSLEVNLKPLSSLIDAPAVSLLDRPYLHLLFVLCDDNEAYRTTVRGQIRDWVDSILARHKQEWLIVHVTSGRIAGAKFYQRKGSVADKIRADFTTGKRDRCVQVLQSLPTDTDPTTWAEFAVKVKEGILVTFDANVVLYEEDVKKADSQRQLEGWQYCTFFFQKEELADSFEAMTLFEDALMQYDELEASFFQSLKENDTAWFGKIGGIAPGDDALPLLSTTNKPYRKLILANAISIFDFRIYLFARQAALLAQMGRITDVAKRGAYFISTFARTLRENETTLGRNFVESWTYSACLNIVDECQRYLETSSKDSSTIANFVAAKAELLELARKQLDKIGMEAGHLPLTHPFSMSLNEKTTQEANKTLLPKTVAERPPVTRVDLLEAIADRDVFDKLYIDLTNRSIQAYQASRRKRCSLKLHASLAALEAHRERFSSAQKLFSHLPAHYVDLRWVKIEASLLSQSTALQGRLDMSKERLLSTLALLRAGIELGSKSWSLGLEGDGTDSVKASNAARLELAKRLTDDVYQLSSTLSKDFAAIAFPTFSMRLQSQHGSAPEEEDGATVNLIVTSLLPCTLAIDEVRLKFSTVAGEQIWFTAGGCSLAKGETVVTLFCPTSIRGWLTLELSQIRFSRIIFQYSYRTITNKHINDQKAYFPPDPQALNVFLELPKQIDLNVDRQCIICIATGRNHLTKILLRSTSSNPEVSLDLGDAKLVDGSAKLGSLSADGALLMEDLPVGSINRLQFSIGGNLREAFIPINVVAEYFTTRRPGSRRTLKRTLDFTVSLPLAVNVQDFFRKDFLLSKYSVTTGGKIPLRIKSAYLESKTAHLSVQSCRSKDAPMITILPSQSANFLFKIFRADPVASPPSLNLAVTYCSVEEELLSRIIESSRLILSSSDKEITPSESYWISKLMIDQARVTTTFQKVEKLEVLFDERRWRQELEERCPSIERMNILLAEVKAAYEKFNSPPTPASEKLPLSWRTLTIPVTMPSLTILNIVDLTPPSLSAELGEPISVLLTICPTFNWAVPPAPESVVLVYDIIAGADDWLFSGRKKAEFVAVDGVETRITLTLISLRPGSIILPSVSIRPLDSGSGNGVSCETQHSAASVAIEVLPSVSRKTFTSFELS